MKLCWDTLEGMVLRKGRFFNGRHYYVEVDSCSHCGEPFLTRADYLSKYCSHSCVGKTWTGEKNSRWKGGIRSNPEYLVKWSKNWRINNPDKHCAKEAIRRSRKLNQTPPDANLKEIEWLYSICQQMCNRIGKPGYYEVDHINPLANGGLHHENNLQILTSKQNKIKGARV